MAEKGYCALYALTFPIMKNGDGSPDAHRHGSLLRHFRSFPARGP